LFNAAGTQKAYYIQQKNTNTFKTDEPVIDYFSSAVSLSYPFYNNYADDVQFIFLNYTKNKLFIAKIKDNKIELTDAIDAYSTS